MNGSIPELVAGLSPILVAGIVGWLILRLVGGGSFAHEYWHLTYPVGSGILTFLLFLLSWSGVSLELSSVAVTATALTLTLSLLTVAKRGRGSSGEVHPTRLPADPGSRAAGVILILAVGSLTLVALVLSVERSYSVWDGMAIWSVKGYGIAREGTIWAAEEWGTHGLSYPLNIPLQISVFELLDGDWLPHSKLIFPLYFLSLAVGLISFLRRRLSLPAAGLASLLMLSAPIVFDHSTNGYANLAFSTYLVLGLLTMIDDCPRPDRARGVTAGILLGLAVWTRPEGFILASAGSLCTWLACRLPSSGSPWLATWASPLLLLGLPWFVFTVAGGSQGFARDAIRAVWDGWWQSDFRLGDVYAIIKYLGWQALRVQFWGVCVPVLGVVLVFAASRFRIGVPFPGLPILVAAISIFVAVASYYYLAGAVTDLEYLLSTSGERVAMPGMLLWLTWMSTLLPASQASPPNGALGARHPPADAVLGVGR